MAIAKKVTFVDAVTVVDAAWLNLLQQHLASLMQLHIETPTATQVRLTAGSDDAAAAVYIGGQQRYRDTNTSFTFTSEPSGTYGVYVTAPAGVDTFSLKVTTGVPTTTPYRKVAEVVWNGAAITRLSVEGRDHAHSPVDGSGVLAHADLTGLTSGDPHPQYMLPDGSRDFTGTVGGVTATLDSHLARKDYVDGLAGPALPLGAIIPFAGEASPGGWAVCNGQGLDTTTYAALFAVIGYTYGGSGSTFNLPDLRDRFPLGKTAAGTGSTLGDTGGSLLHSHTQPTHTHTTTAHTHGSASHTHSFPTSGNSSVEHSHTQGSTGSSGDHTHTGPSHTHSATSLTQAYSGGAVVGATNGSSATAGLFSYNTVYQASDETSHTHSAGSYNHSTLGALSGTSSSAAASHYHAPAGNAYGSHDHPGGSVSGSTAAAGTGSTGSSGSHTHTNPSTSTSTAHTHTGGTSGGASPTFDSDGAGVTSADGDEVTGTAAPPYLVMNYLMRVI